MPMKVISLNANGIRAAARKGFFEWMAQQNPDVVCVQETKAQMHQLDADHLYPDGYYHCFSDAEKKGYSGVGIYCKKKPKKIIHEMGLSRFDCEGRYIQVDFDEVSVASVYFPSGTTGDIRQAVKMDFLSEYLSLLKRQVKKGSELIICGDVNIVHKEIDIKNWKANQKHSGCLPEERAWLDTIFDEVGMVDAFRVVNQEPHQYTWWSNRGQAYAKNVGWRIDYQIITPGLKDKVKSVEIYKEQRFSDHAPLIIDYDLT